MEELLAVGDKEAAFAAEPHLLSSRSIHSLRPDATPRPPLPPLANHCTRISAVCRSSRSHPPASDLIRRPQAHASIRFFPFPDRSVPGMSLSPSSLSLTPVSRPLLPASGRCLMMQPSKRVSRQLHHSFLIIARLTCIIPCLRLEPGHSAGPCGSGSAAERHISTPGRDSESGHKHCDPTR